MNKSYIITNIRPDLLKYFKMFCAHHEISMRSCFIDYMEKVVTHFRRADIVKDSIDSKPDDLFK